MATYPEQPAPSAYATSPDQSLHRTIVPPMPGSLAAPDRLTLQQQANALVGMLERADNLLDRMSMAPANGASTSSELPLGHALSVATERMNALLERLSSLATHVGQI